MRKGFIGPIGDDLPAMIAVMLALGLFFSGMVVTLDTYNQKILYLGILNGGMDISRSVLGAATFTGCTPPNTYGYLAKSYGLEADVYIESASPQCVAPAQLNCAQSKNYVTFTYFVAIASGSDVKPAKLVVKVCK